MRREAIGHCSYYCMGKKRRFSFLSSKIVSLCKTTHVLKNLDGAIDSGFTRVGFFRKERRERCEWWGRSVPCTLRLPLHLRWRGLGQECSGGALQRPRPSSYAPKTYPCQSIQGLYVALAFATYALLSRHSWGKLTRKAITARKRKIDY